MVTYIINNDEFEQVLNSKLTHVITITIQHNAIYDILYSCSLLPHPIEFIIFDYVHDITKLSCKRESTFSSIQIKCTNDEYNFAIHIWRHYNKLEYRMVIHKPTNLLRDFKKGFNAHNRHGLVLNAIMEYEFDVIDYIKEFVTDKYDVSIRNDNVIIMTNDMIGAICILNYDKLIHIAKIIKCIIDVSNTYLTTVDLNSYFDS